MLSRAIGVCNDVKDFQKLHHLLDLFCSKEIEFILIIPCMNFMALLFENYTRILQSQASEQRSLIVLMSAAEARGP